MIHCKNHLDRQAKYKGLCNSCYMKELKRNNPEFAERQREAKRQWRKKNKERERLTARNYNLKREYGLTHDDYLKQLEFQNNRCAICNKINKQKHLHIDHCHKTGKFRGLLCGQCNSFLGTIEQDKETFIRLSQYGKITKQIHPDIKQQKVKK